MDTTLCSQCMQVPAPPITEGTLVLAGLDPEVGRSLFESLSVYGIVPTAVADGIWSFDLFDGGCEIIRDWARLASPAQLQEASYVQLPVGEGAGFRTYG